MQKPTFERVIAIEEWVCDDVISPLGQLTIAGTATHRGIAPHSMRVLGCYALIYLLEGEGHFQDANRNRATVKPGDLLLLFPGVAHSYGPTTGGLWREMFVHFEGPLFDLMQTNGILDSRRPVHNAAPIEVWSRQLLDLSRTVRLENMADSTDKICRLASLLTRLTNDTPLLPPQEDWFEHGCRILKGNINEPIVLQDVAKAVGMSYNAFREKFGERAGQPPGRYRSRERIEVAQRMLEREELTSRAVAIALGFGDEANFSRTFRQFAGVSPRQYRQKKRRENAEAVAQVERIELTAE